MILFGFWLVTQGPYLSLRQIDDTALFLGSALHLPSVRGEFILRKK